MKEEGDAFLFFSEVSQTWTVSWQINDFATSIYELFGNGQCPWDSNSSNDIVQCLDGTESDGYIREIIAGWEIRYEPGVFEYQPALRDTLTKGLL